MYFSSRGCRNSPCIFEEDLFHEGVVFDLPFSLRLAMQLKSPMTIQGSVTDAPMVSSSVNNTPLVPVCCTVNKGAVEGITYIRIDDQMDDLAANELYVYFHFLGFPSYYNPTSLVKS